MDIADCRDIVSLQAIVHDLVLPVVGQAIYLLRLHWRALRSALRMGLHVRSMTTLIYRGGTRKRVFW